MVAPTREADDEQQATTQQTTLGDYPETTDYHTHDDPDTDADADAELWADGRREALAQHDDVVVSVGPWSTHAGTRGGIPAQADPANWVSDYRAGTPPYRRRGETLAQQEERHSRTEESTGFSTQVRRTHDAGHDQQKTVKWSQAIESDTQSIAPELSEIGGGNPTYPHEEINPYTRLDRETLATVNTRGMMIADKYDLDPIQVKNRLAWEMAPVLNVEFEVKANRIPVGHPAYQSAKDELKATQSTVASFTALEVGSVGIDPHAEQTSIQLEITNIYTDPKEGTAMAGKGRDEHGKIVHWAVWEKSLLGEYEPLRSCLSDKDEPDKDLSFTMGDTVRFLDVSPSQYYDTEMSIAVTSDSEVRVTNRTPKSPHDKKARNPTPQDLSDRNAEVVEAYNAPQTFNGRTTTIVDDPTQDATIADHARTAAMR